MVHGSRANRMPAREAFDCVVCGTTSAAGTSLICVRNDNNSFDSAGKQLWDYVCLSCETSYASPPLILKPMPVATAVALAPAPARVEEQPSGSACSPCNSASATQRDSFLATAEFLAVPHWRAMQLLAQFEDDVTAAGGELLSAPKDLNTQPSLE